MFRYVYDSDFPMWTDRDMAWHRRLKKNSCNQIAVSTTLWRELNNKQKKLLLSKYTDDIIIIPQYSNNSLFFLGKIEGIVCLMLTKENENDFFNENQFGAMWDIVYTSISSIYNILNIINNGYLKNIKNVIDFEVVISTLQKIYDDSNASKTEIISKHDFRGSECGDRI